MPRDASGNYTLPTGNPVVTGTVVSSTWANDTMQDLRDEMQDSLSRSGNGGMLAPIRHVNGTVGAPAISFTSEATSGIYRAAAGDLRVAVQGVDVLRIINGVLYVWSVDDSAFYPIISGGNVNATLFDTVADMAASDISAGFRAETLGFSAAGDGLGEAYLIVAPQALGPKDVQLDNGNVAVLQQRRRLDTRYSPVFATSTAMTSTNPLTIDGTPATLVAGMTVHIQGSAAAGDGGHEEYLVKTVLGAGDTLDEQRYGFTLANGLFAIWQGSGSGQVVDYNYDHWNRQEYQYDTPPLTTLNGFVLTGQSLAEGGVGGDVVSPSLSPYPSDILMLSSAPLGLNTQVLGSSFVTLQEPSRSTISSSYLRGVNTTGTNLMHGQAWGGKTYDEIKKGGTTGVYEKILVQAADSFNNNGSLEYKAVQVIHGEADGLINNTTYDADLLEWKTNFNTDLKAVTGQAANIPMLLCQVGSSAGYSRVGGIASDEFPTQLLQLQAHVDNSDIYLVTPKYQLEYADHSHITNQAQAILGEYYAKAFNTILSSGTFDPLRPATVTGSGNKVTITFAGRVGDLVMDTTNVNSIANNGFEYEDDSANTISSVAIVSNTVEITLSGTIGTNPRVAYAYNNGTATGAAGQVAGNGARGNLRDSDPTASIYGSTPLYNWCVIFRESVTV